MSEAKARTAAAKAKAALEARVRELETELRWQKARRALQLEAEARRAAAQEALRAQILREAIWKESIRREVAAKTFRNSLYDRWRHQGWNQARRWGGTPGNPWRYNRWGDKRSRSRDKRGRGH